MNRGVLQLQSAPPVQQLMAASAGGGGPNWPWNVNGTRQQPPPFFNPGAAAAATYLSPHAPPPFPFHSWHNSSNSITTTTTQDELSVDHQSLSQLLLYESRLSHPRSWGGLMAGAAEGKCRGDQVIQGKRMGLTWYDHDQEQQGLMMELQAPRNDGADLSAFDMNMKRESSGGYDLYGGRADHHHPHHPQDHPFDQPSKHTCLSQLVLNNNVPSAANNNCAPPSPNILDFSTRQDPRHPPPDPSSSECNTTGGGGAFKRARVQSASSTQQSPFKVRKEKLGDRITALHQLVSPFGKTDTASVLLEAIGYIRFLQTQIEALSLPYLGGAATANNRRHQHSVHGDGNSIFPEHPGQLFNDNGMKGKEALEQESKNVEGKNGLRSKGLCLVPVSCTLQVGSDNGADYWALPFHGGAFN